MYHASMDDDVDMTNPREMVCRCGDNDPQVVEQAQALLLQSGIFLEEHIQNNLLSCIVMALNEFFGVTIDGIYAGQWFVVCASKYHYVDQEKVVEWTTSIACDIVEDGIAAILLDAQEKFGKENQTIGDD